jgi:cell volume regulation protein A
LVSLVVREGKPFTPKPDQPVRTGDDLLIVTNGADRKKVEARLRSIASGGRLARWQSPS